MGSSLIINIFFTLVFKLWMPMLKDYTISISLLFSTLYSFGQYCTTCGPSTNADSNVESVLFTGVSGSINHIGCPSQIGVEVYLNESVTVSAGSSYSLQVDYGTCGGNYASAGTVWIDFDQSQTFSQNEIVGTWTGTPPTAPVIYNVQVPTNAHNGPTRMRVTQQEAGVLPLNPCASFSWGSVMDFGVTIINGIDCGVVFGDVISAPIDVTTLPYTDSGDLSFCYSNQNLVYDSPDVYYKLNLNPTLQSILVNSCGSSFDTFISVIDPNGNVISYNDDGPSCAPQSELTFDVNDLGFVYIIVEGWGNQSGLYELEINANYLDINENHLENISVYPNPTNDVLNLSKPIENIVIIDVSGKTIAEYSSVQYQIFVQNLNPGFYLLKGIVLDKDVTVPFYKY